MHKCKTFMSLALGAGCWVLGEARSLARLLAGFAAAEVGSTVALSSGVVSRPCTLRRRRCGTSDGAGGDRASKPSRAPLSLAQLHTSVYAARRVSHLAERPACS